MQEYFQTDSKKLEIGVGVPYAQTYFYFAGKLVRNIPDAIYACYNAP
jgi:hypothetical protein